jgi:putative transposase
MRSMARKRRTAEEIVAKLRQVDVLMAQGRLVADAVRAIGVTEVTYYRWRNEYGGLKGDQVKRPQGTGDREHPSSAGGIRPDAG